MKLHLGISVASLKQLAELPELRTAVFLELPFGLCGQPDLVHPEFWKNRFRRAGGRSEGRTLNSLVEAGGVMRREFFRMFSRNCAAIAALNATEISLTVDWENAFADQIRKREMLLRFDETRRNCSAIRESNSVLGMEKRLLSDTLDQLAIYLRRESDRLTPEDVNALYPLVTDLFKISARLKKSEPSSQENKLDSSFYLNNLLKKYAIE